MNPISLKRRLLAIFHEETALSLRKELALRDSLRRVIEERDLCRARLEATQANLDVINGRLGQ